MEKRYDYSIISIDDIDIDSFNAPQNKTIFTTKQWIEYLSEDSGAIPIIVKIEKEKKLIGYFTCLKMNKFGIGIVASPFEGWSTCHMGFDLVQDANRMDILPKLCDFLYRECKCSYIEVTDRSISIEKAQKYGFMYMSVDTLELEIDRTDEELFKVFKTDCRNFIRQFERRGATIDIAKPDDVFAEEYYSQLEDVFAKQGLVPTYSCKKVKCILKHLKDTDNVLCLRVRDPEGNSIATSIFFGYKNKFYFWGGASYRSGQHYRPNEYMLWTAIKYWRDRGCVTFDMVGVRDYKRKFGSHEEVYAKLIFTKHPILLPLRNMAKKAYFILIKVKGLVRHKK